MDSDSYRSFYDTFNKTYSPNINRYSNSPQKTNKIPFQKPQSYRNQYKSSNRTINQQQSTMNQLAPRFQQRAIYSQNYRTDYESSWRANLLAASYRARCNSKRAVVKIIHLGERPDPEGAPSSKIQENETKKDCIDYETVLNNDVSLYSDYGSDSDDVSGGKEENEGVDSEQNVPDHSWSTASLLTHAFNKASSNKVTIMSYAVIEAELNSINKLQTTKAENDLSKLTKRTLRITESIDNARKSLKDIALGLRSLKQEIKSKNKKSSGNKEKSQKNASDGRLSQSEQSVSVGFEKRSSKSRLSGLIDKPTLPIDSLPLSDYCTIGRRHKSRPSNKSNYLSDPKFSMIKYMNLDVANKRSSSDEY